MRKNNFYLLTLGCQMNKNDSERIAGLLLSEGWKQSKTPEKADLIILNTCSVRASAEDRVFGFVQNWKELKAKNPRLVIAVTGCMAGRDKDGKIRKRLPDVDLFFGIDSLPMLTRWVEELRLDGEVKTKDKESGDYLEITPFRSNPFHAFITIQTGCDNFCTYCVVPYARGREKNRSIKEIIKEIKLALKNGAKEITLLGQTVNHYIAPDVENFSKNNPFHDHFAALLWEINQIKGEFRINFTAPDPQYFSNEQIQALALPKQANYLHLPVQSGDNEILKKMNRKYTREQYIGLIKKIRAARPEISIGTDIIVGFCGETAKQFQNTVDLYKQCDFDISFHAMYSERSLTAAVKAFKDDVPKDIKKQRWDVLQNLMEQIVLRKNQKYVGQAVRVLVDKCESGVCSGNSDEMKLVEFPSKPSMVGKFVKVKINWVGEWVLRGKAQKV